MLVMVMMRLMLLLTIAMAIHDEQQTPKDTRGGDHTNTLSHLQNSHIQVQCRE
jgi:hypothetical protein